MSDGRSLDRRRFLASAGRSAVAAGATMTGLAWPTSRAHALGEPLVGAARLVIPGLDDLRFQERKGALDQVPLRAMKHVNRPDPAPLQLSQELVEGLFFGGAGHDRVRAVSARGPRRR